MFGLGIMLWLLFMPRHYSTTHLKERKGTKYWKLPTGSSIAYTLLPAKCIKKKFPLIYLHGGPGAGITDREVKTFSTLADQGYDVYLYDQIGCGHSGRLKNINEYSADRHRKDLEEIVKTINAEKVYLIAQSWGSILAVLYVSENPTKVERLVITAPGPIQPGNNRYASIAAPDSFHFRTPYFTNRMGNEKAENIRSRTIFYFARTFGMKIASDHEADEFATYLTTELNKSMVCDTSKAVIAEGTEGFYVHYMTLKSFGRLSDPRPKLKNFTAPVLIMKAQCDNQKWGYTQEFLDLFSNSKLVVVPDAGHNIFLEQPGEYVRLIGEFLGTESSIVNVRSNNGKTDYISTVNLNETIAYYRLAFAIHD
jgi:proline iminopeptidase